MMHEICCSNPHCRCKLLRKSNDGMWRFSTKVIKANDDGTGVVAICKSCNCETDLRMQITVPATNTSDIMPSGGFKIIQIKNS